MTETDEERARFEAWAHRAGVWWEIKRLEGSDAKYAEGPMQFAWEAWQAALAARSKSDDL